MRRGREGLGREMETSVPFFSYIPNTGPSEPALLHRTPPTPRLTLARTDQFHVQKC